MLADRQLQSIVQANKIENGCRSNYPGFLSDLSKRFESIFFVSQIAEVLHSLLMSSVWILFIFLMSLVFSENFVLLMFVVCQCIPNYGYCFIRIISVR